MSANPYNPVMTKLSKETEAFAEDEWGLSLPTYNKKYNRGFFSRIKNACYEARKRPRCMLIVIAVLLTLVLLITIIAVASGSDNKRKLKPSDFHNQWTNPKIGLVFYPRPHDNSATISYHENNLDHVRQMKRSMFNAAKMYQATEQVGDDFIECSEDHNPYNKTCKFEDIRFNHVCDSAHSYGYSSGQPCVLIQLNLPPGIYIRPIPSDSPLWNTSRHLRYDSAKVPLICEGKSENDKENLNKKSMKTPRIDYYPSDGFSSYFYRPVNKNLKFIKPAVMVHFNSLIADHPVTIHCTAWGQLYSEKDKQVYNHELLTTEFQMSVLFK